MDLEQAKKDSRNGAHLAFFMAVLLLAVVIFFLHFADAATRATPIGRFYGDPLNFFDIVLYVVAGIGLLRYSRTAAILLFLMIALSAIIKFSELGQASGVVMVLIFLFYAGKAVRGTFAYHRISREENPDYTPPRKWIYYAGIPVALVFVLLVGLGIFSVLGVIPSSRVLPGDKIASSDKEMLREQGILMIDERVDWFYSEGLFSIMEGGNILTDKRVVSYESMDEKLTVYSMKTEDITEIVQTVKGDTFTDTIIEAYNKEGDGVQLYLSNESKGDEQFINDLLKRTQLPLLEPPPEATLEDVTPANVQPARLSE